MALDRRAFLALVMACGCAVASELLEDGDSIIAEAELPIAEADIAPDADAESAGAVAWAGAWASWGAWGSSSS